MLTKKKNEKINQTKREISRNGQLNNKQVVAQQEFQIPLSFLLLCNENIHQMGDFNENLILKCTIFFSFSLFYCLIIFTDTQLMLNNKLLKTKQKSYSAMRSYDEKYKV